MYKCMQYACMKSPFPAEKNLFRGSQECMQSADYYVLKGNRAHPHTAHIYCEMLIKKTGSQNFCVWWTFHIKTVHAKAIFYIYVYIIFLYICRYIRFVVCGARARGWYLSPCTSIWSFSIVVCLANIYPNSYGKLAYVLSTFALAIHIYAYARNVSAVHISRVCIK